MKILCFDCGHRCHCKGQGFYVSTSQCSTCDCYVCNHIEIKNYEDHMGENMFKKIWKKIWNIICWPCKKLVEWLWTR
jgi:hypothetical protein